MELFELIRKDYHHRNKSIRQISRERGIHRRTVREALTNALPAPRKTTVRRSTILKASHKTLIETWALADLSAPKKQRHTGERVYKRLLEQTDYVGSVVTARQYFYEVRKRLQQPKTVFVPQHHEPGVEGEVDWYEAMVDFPTGRQKLYFFQMRACYSGNEFHMAFTRQNQQCFLEAHVAAFDYFGGVFKTIRYDNLSSAVKRILQGRKRIETEKFILLRSHYLFDAQFCCPGIEGAHEKGGVEGGVGRFRRAHLVPVPHVTTLTELNQRLLSACRADKQRVIRGQTDSVQIRWQTELNQLQSLPNEAFDTAEVLTPVVNNKSLVAVKGNLYSVPTQWVGQTVEARVYGVEVIIFKQGQCIARHARHYEQHKMIIDLLHYLALLRYKPGALPGSVALKQARETGHWPKLYDDYWQALQARFELHQANRHMVDFLWWAKDFQHDDIEIMMGIALECGSIELDAIKLLMRQHLHPQSAATSLEQHMLGHLQQYERPLSGVGEYDNLINTAGVAS